MTFNDLGICDSIQKALLEEGYNNPTPIQEQSIPTLLEGTDLLASAQTGTGKTAAFAIPILQQLYLNPPQRKGPRKIKALVITPTRELAIQIAESFDTYGKYTGLNNTVIFGGVKQEAQVNALRRGVDILIATPGRLLDLMDQGYINLKNLAHFVLDEADRMLDMGFVHDIRKLIDRLPRERQSLFFSATMPPSVVELSGKILGSHPDKVEIKPEQTTAERVEQSMYFVSKKWKPKLLLHLLQTVSYESVIVFTRTKHGADKVVRILEKSGIVSAAIHGNKSQNARQRALNNFKDGKIKVLLATDIAARGIDIDQLSLVINFDLPNIPETYVHRIGRTGRAVSSGAALSFCDVEERPYLRDIQRFINQQIPVVADHPFPDDEDEAFVVKPSVKKKIAAQPRDNRAQAAGDNRNRNRNKRKPNYRGRR
ncbi:DEAD/DEAH box helicase [Mangrovibacterium marinum]|uniref:ATP-dependent RNA helicase RhlE n=1 Tax=Mangrovibacterium marinum TaxID=1639118 RepID=A0A2T5BYD6_9BACT|nr:DEAD/DEAH box helicase [Mangrovibacterium marinum]PTN07245.1 ATP-dependent RNA helicase RhlE [Mangrovibacterium marinum]